jgi:hypothetical protein
VQTYVKDADERQSSSEVTERRVVQGLVRRRGGGVDNLGPLSQSRPFGKH